jgi:hypothetical protein
MTAAEFTDAIIAATNGVTHTLVADSTERGRIGAD